ncbi:MAG: hypothetical protein K6B44_02665 [Lachnospiraceae bacterium]|nr:hypothetical protein [Lachnospiraceae bacterium]
MNRDKYRNLTDILKLGLDSQDRLADLNKVASDRIKSSDYSRVYDMLGELVNIAEETDIKKSAEKEKRLDELCSEFSVIRLELLKEAELLASLRSTNEHYITLLDKDIEEAGAYLSEPVDTTETDAYTKYDTMQKRAQELSVTKNVAVSFSEQIKLSEVPLRSLSDRILSVLMNLIPLLRGRLSAEKSRIMADELRKLITLSQPA